MVNLSPSPVTQVKPARIFLSYKRNIEPDESLARQIETALTSRGHSVFIDQKLKVGQPWAEEIEAQLQASDFLVVFLTDGSSHSEMVKGEIEIARRQAERAGRPRILPVRVAFAGGLPYPLNAYLDQLQYVMWRGVNDTHKLVAELHQVICGCTVDLPVEQSAVAGPSADLPPAYAAPLPAPGGTLEVDDPWYLVRPADAKALSVIRQGGQTLIIKGPRQMGKSSLLMRTVAEALAAGKQVALLDFQLLDQTTRTSSDLFFRRFVADISRRLYLPDEVDEFWEDSPQPQNCTSYLEQCILAKLSEPLLIAIDEVDAMFGASFWSDFFSMLRHWHNRRADPVVKRFWKKLDLALVTSTEPYMFIDMKETSPFNVGETAKLSDFLPDQVHELNRLHHSPLFPQEVDNLYALLNGHPYLTRKALYVVSKGLTPDELFQTVTDDSGPFGDHLRHYLLRLQRHPDLSRALWQVVEGRGCDDEEIAYRLESAGLVKKEAARMIPRCKLYAEFFHRRLKSRG